MCECRARIDASLEAKNARLAAGFVHKGATLELSPPLIELEKINPRGKKPPILMASYCPFCGEHFEKPGNS
jgi:hypothetical protein